MENDKFQELVIKQFGEIQNQFGKVFKQLDRLEVFAKQHHEELELVARQVETQEIKDISKSILSGKSASQKRKDGFVVLPFLTSLFF